MVGNKSWYIFVAFEPATFSSYLMLRAYAGSCLMISPLDDLVAAGKYYTTYCLLIILYINMGISIGGRYPDTIQSDGCKNLQIVFFMF